MKGQGIALALSISSALNTVLLFIFMKKMPSMEYGKIAKGMALYALKMILFAAIATVPTYISRPHLLKLFEGQNRFLSFGIPIIAMAGIFFVTGTILLLIFRDKTALSFVEKIKGRFGK